MAELIVKDNALINASYNLDLVEQRLVLLAIIEARESQKGINANDALTIHASSYIQYFNVEKNTAYEALKNACDVLFSRQFSYQERNKNGNIENIKSRWVSEIRYIDKEASVKLIFSPSVVPLITRLERHFTSYEIEQVRHLSSRYAIRLYEILIQWRSIGKTPKFEINDFRELLGLTIEDYPRIDNFKRKILDFSISQINEHTDILVGYEQHKAGRVITGFSFTFSQKKQLKDVTPDTKKAKPKPTEDLNTLLHDKKFLEKHARAGESWDDVRSRLKNEAETGKFSLAPTN